jgi:hypothetical protein
MAIVGKVKSYKSAKGLGKPKSIREAKAVERRLDLKYPGMKEKHAAAVKKAGESGLTKLAKRIRKRKKTKAKGPSAAKLLTSYAKRSGGK